MTAHCRITPGETIGDAFRGRFLDKCAIVEQWALTVLEAADHKLRSSHLFGQKLRAVRELASAEPSHFRAPKRVLHLLDSFQPLAELRTRLAHSIQTIAQAEDGTRRFIFTPVRSCADDHLSVVLNEDDMARLTGVLGRLAKEFGDQQLRRLSPSSPPPPKPGAAACP